MKKKFIVLISVIVAVAALALAAVSIFTKNYVQGADIKCDEIYQISRKIGTDSMFVYKYNAQNYDSIEVNVERYENGEQLEEPYRFILGSGEDSTIESGEIAVDINDDKELRLAVTISNGDTMTNTKYVDIGAPAELGGDFMEWMTEKEKIEEGEAIPLLFVGYSDGQSDHGYGSGLQAMEHNVVDDYGFCYRVTVRFLVEETEY